AAAAAPSISHIATFAPEAENRSAMARPMPRAAPVTIAIRPSRSIRFIASSLSLYSLGTRMPTFSGNPDADPVFNRPSARRFGPEVWMEDLENRLSAIGYRPLQKSAELWQVSALG